MDIQTHGKKFKEVIEKHGLAEKADEIAEYIIKTRHIDVKEFSKLFNIDEEDAEILISFIHKGIKFKEKHIDSSG